MYSIILVAPWAIYMSSAFLESGQRNNECYLSHEMTDCLSILFQFQVLIANTLYFPTCEVDGKEEVVRYNRLYETEYLATLKKDCASLIKGTNTVASENCVAKKEMDKPNVHRLLELYNHTIPLVGHVKHCQELLFEGAHQPLKRGLKQSNNRNGHLTAMDDVLANDWKLRLSSHIQSNNLTDASDLSEEQCRKLQRLLCGNDKLHFAGERQDILSRIRNSLTKPAFEHLLSIESPQSGKRRQEKIWHSIYQRNDDDGKYMQSPDTSDALDYIHALYEQDIRSGSSIRRAFQAKYEMKTPSEQFVSDEKQESDNIFTIRKFDIIQVPVKWKDDYISRSSSKNVSLLFTQEDCDDCNSTSSCERRFWIVLDILTVERKQLAEGFENRETSTAELPIAVVWPLIEDTSLSHSLSKYYKIFRVNSDCPQFIVRLHSSVKKVMSLHVCDRVKETSCQVMMGAHGCLHSGSVLEEELMVVFGTKEGYPPRVG